MRKRCGTRPRCQEVLKDQEHIYIGWQAIDGPVVDCRNEAIESRLHGPFYFRISHTLGFSLLAASRSDIDVRAAELYYLPTVVD